MSDPKLSSPAPSISSASGSLHRALWRWHFYAGLFCVPFILILALTGSIYLFKPQVEGLLDRPYDQLAFVGAPASADAQVAAALAAVPGSKLKAYELRQNPHDAPRVTVKGKAGDILVFVHPQSLTILKTVAEKDRFMEVIKTLHGALLMGRNGSILVELAASWAIVMIATGLYLWWPRQAQGLAGVIWPRLRMGSKLFWRDLHAVTGVWISSLALFLLLSGLPWAPIWGDGFKAVRQMTHTRAVRQDWTQAGSREAAPTAAPHSEHDGMDMGAMAGKEGMEGMMHPALTPPSIETMAQTLRPLGLAAPVLISPPSKRSPDWTGRSDAQNRTLRTTLTLDPYSGAILSREDFKDRHPIDRVVGVAIAAHEGQLFGLANQLLGVLTALGLSTLAVSGLVMWWRRRPKGRLGAPLPLGSGKLSLGLGGLIIALGLFLPVLGLSMVALALLERLVLRWMPSVRTWLGLRDAATSQP
jgi:uncharacterized iron-regulated membrane protein